MRARLRPSATLGIGLGAAMLALLPVQIGHAEPGSPVHSPSSLYERMGGQTVVTRIAEELIDRSAADPVVKRSLEKTDLPRLKKLLGEQLCALTGGPCVYSGDSMKDVHAGHDIRQDEFYGMVELLREVLNKHGVGLSERNELLALLAPMKRDVVTR